MELAVPAAFTVTREGVRLSASQIQEVVESFLAVHFANLPYRMSIEKMRVNEEVVVPAGRINYMVVPPKRTDFRGTVHLPVDVMVDGKKERRIWVTADIVCHTEVVAIRRPVERHGMLQQADVERIEMDVSRLPSDVITDIQDAIGKRVKHSLKPGAALRAEWIEIPPLVKKGEVVTVVAEKEGLRVSTIGETCSSGRLGERIRVVNLSTKRSVYAIVVDEKTVHIDF
jgi:flagella basal body P-ring formation protein FlgA